MILKRLTLSLSLASLACLQACAEKPALVTSCADFPVPSEHVLDALDNDIPDTDVETWNWLDKVDKLWDKSLAEDSE